MDRRALLKATAWGAPALIATTALPAAAASDGVIVPGASQWDPEAGTGWASFELLPSALAGSQSYIGFTVYGIAVTALQRSGFDYSKWTVNFNSAVPPGPATFGLVLTIPGYTPTIMPIGK